jgi:hypothetical protein
MYPYQTRYVVHYFLYMFRLSTDRYTFFFKHSITQCKDIKQFEYYIQCTLLANWTTYILVRTTYIYIY